MAEKCAECGSALEDDARFCTECGHPVDGGDAIAPPPDPPEAPAAPAAPAGPALTIRVPEWLARDWFGAVTFAFLALVIGLIIQYLIGVLLIFIQWAPEGGSIEWSETVRAPLTTFLAFHGPLDGVGVWLMAAVWLWVAFRLAGMLLTPERLVGRDTAPSLWAAFVAKVGLVYIVPVTVLAAVLDAEPSAISSAGGVGLMSGFRDPYGADWNVAVTFFLGLLIVLVVASLVLSRRMGKSVLHLFGLSSGFTWPPVLSAAWAGAKRALSIILPLVLALMVIGSLLEYAGSDPGFRTWLTFALLLVYGGLLLSGADIAVFYSILSMRFYLGDEVVVVGDRPAWMWVGVAIVVVGFLLGGIHAAEKRKAATAGQAGLAGLLVGPAAALIMFVASWFVIGVPDTAIVGPALGLPLLWALASAAGGLLYANRKGLVSGLQFEVASPPDSEE